MKLYSRKNKEDLLDIFDVYIHFPRIKWGTKPGDPWGNDYAHKYFECMFDNQLICHSDETFCHFKLILFGLGFSITRQTG